MKKTEVYQKSVTTRTLDKIRAYLQTHNVAFSVGHISETLGIHYYYAQVAIGELLKNNEIRELPATTQGRLFLKNE